MTAADELLAQVQTEFRDCRRNHRDRMLECGRKLHQFVLAYIQQGDAVSEPIRLANGFSRRNAIRKAVESLRARPTKICDMIATAMFVDLVASHEDLATIGYVAAVQFKRFVGRKIMGRHSGGKDGHRVSTSEEWEIKDGFADSSLALFRKAIAENWDQYTCRRECQRLYSGIVIPKKSRSFTKRVELPLMDLQRSVGKASPGDVAELCVSLLDKAEDPAAVAVRLRVMLERYLPKRVRAM